MKANDNCIIAAEECADRLLKDKCGTRGKLVMAFCCGAVYHQREERQWNIAVMKLLNKIIPADER